MSRSRCGCGAFLIWLVISADHRLSPSFKHHFSLIIPLEQFLSTTSPTPTHGFLLTAILQHVSRALPETLQLTPTSHAHLDDLLQQSLFYILAGTGSEEVILGLLVLSLATTRKGEWEYRPRPSALRLVSLAFQIGSATGLAAACRASLTLGEDLKPMWMRAKRKRMQLVSVTVFASAWGPVVTVDVDVAISG